MCVLAGLRGSCVRNRPAASAIRDQAEQVAVSLRVFLRKPDTTQPFFN